MSTPTRWRCWRPSPSRRLGDERGSAVVEFVLVLPVFVALLLGTITAGAAYDHKQELTNAAQEAARYGATLSVSQCDLVAYCGGLDWAQAVQAMAVSLSNGTLSTGEVCAALVSGPGDAPVAYDSTHTTAGGSSPCFVDNSSDTGPRVQVLVTRGDSLDALFFSRSLTISASSVAVYEGSVS